MQPVKDQITSSQRLTVPSINSYQEYSKNLLETEKLEQKGQSKQTSTLTTTIIGDSMIKKVFGNKFLRELNYKNYVVVRLFGGAKTQ